MHTVFWWRHLKTRNHLEYLGVHATIILKRILEKQDERTWPVFVWLIMGTCGVVFRTGQ